MDKSNVTFGILWVGIGAFTAFLPYSGLLSRGEVIDPRMPPVCFVIGLVFLIMGLASKSEKAVPQPIQLQPPQQVVNTLVICPRCGSRVSAGSKFCPECGTSHAQPIQQQPPQQIVKTLVICPKCGNRVSAESKFCPECGTSLTPANPQPTYSDNRQATTTYASIPKSELTPPSPLWYLLPIFLGLLGGILGYVLVKDRDREMAKRLLYVSIGMMFVWSLFTYLWWMW